MHIKKSLSIYTHLGILTQMPSSECQGEIVGHLQASHPRVLTKPIPHYKILPILPSLLDGAIHK